MTTMTTINDFVLENTDFDELINEACAQAASDHAERFTKTVQEVYEEYGGQCYLTENQLEYLISISGLHVDWRHKT